MRYISNVFYSSRNDQLVEMLMEYCCLLMNVIKVNFKMFNLFRRDSKRSWLIVCLVFQYFTHEDVMAFLLEKL